MEAIIIIIIISSSSRNEYIHSFSLFDKCINDVTVFSVIFYDHWFTKLYFFNYPLSFLYADLITL